MKLKALLLGSAAAMIAVSGARAADAVVAEPEPMEYVKVCDMYGAGFFYIPGTETCINFNGYVRVDATKNTDVIIPATPAGFRFDPTTGLAVAVPAVAAYTDSTSTWSVRSRLNVDVRNETDFGTLRSEIRFQADNDASADQNVAIDRALISLGGFRLGYSDSYTTTHHGYGLPGIEKYDGPYGYDQAIFFDYTYAANGFSATIGTQDSVGASGTAANPHIDSEYYAGVGYSGSMFGVQASYLWEDNTDEGSWKVSADVRPIEGLTIKGWYMADDGVTRAVGGANDWQWGVGASYAVTDAVTVAAGYSDVDVGESAWTVGLNWQAAPGLSIRPNIEFRENTGESYSVRVYRTF